MIIYYILRFNSYISIDSKKINKNTHNGTCIFKLFKHRTLFMFADKLQNPFLKPSPFTATTTSYTSSYTSAIPPAPRFSSYKPYE